MRFLNTSTLEFEQIPDSELHLKKNQYAILSHRWGLDEEEVSFEDVSLSADLSHKKGFDKLKGFCREASSRGCRYGWVDTCCINKKDSVELGEAINSMYRWYQTSKTCIVYLVDVPQKQLTESEWFDRGWTLQELIAPKVVSFFDHDWNFIGAKTDILSDLSRKTGISKGILDHTTKLSNYSIAQRMSWAAKRETMRVEDRAYSLMGLFDVYMPMIYGERERAFLRLQQHIIQKSKDESIFAWDMDFPGSTRTYSGIYAPSPLAYVRCSKIFKTNGSHGFSESNGELSIRSRTLPRSRGTYFALLNCTERDYPKSRIFILIGYTSKHEEHVRVRDARSVGRELIPIEDMTRFQKQQIRVLVDPKRPPIDDVLNGFWLRTLQPPGHHNCLTTIFSNGQTRETDHVYQDEQNQGVAGIVHLDSIDSSDISGKFRIHSMIFDFDKKFNPILILLANNKRSGQSESQLRQAMVSGTGSQECRNLMKTCKKGGRMIWLGWDMLGEPCESFEVHVDTTGGLHERVIERLNVKISVQLQLRHNPTTISATNVDDRSQTSKSNPMSEWVVDITDAGGACLEQRHRGKNTKRIKGFFKSLTNPGAELH